MRMLPLVLLAVGCVWVSPDDVTTQLKQVDDDQDGSPAEADCDDLDGARFPGAVDAPYDGVDADCLFNNDYDQDADGYVPAAYAGLPTGSVPGSETLPGGDCDDFAPEIHPDAVDDWYDGLDTNCDGRDDYDQDGDMFVPDEHHGRATQGVEGSGGLLAGDCDDLAEGVHPDADDAWYDGVDTNCDGIDDFDVDGDGWVPDGDGGLATLYVPTSGHLPEGDCDDANATIHPEAVDEWYDGVDANCLYDDDYDQDLDHHADPSGGGDDCDDTAPEEYPGHLETVGDSIDSDCDGGADSFALGAIGGCTWVEPRSPTFVGNSTSIFLSVAASELNCGTHLFDSAVALRMDVADPLGGVVAVDEWIANTRAGASSLSAGQSVLVDEDYLYGLVGTHVSSGRAMLLVRYPLGGGPADTLSLQDTSNSEDFEDVSLAIGDDGALGALGCESLGGHLFFAQASDISSGTPDFYTTESGAYATGCALGTSSVRPRIYTTEAMGVYRRDFTYGDNALDVGAPASFVSGTITDLDWDGGDTLFLANRTDNAGEQRGADDASLTALDSGRGPLALDVRTLGSTTWYGYVDATGAAWLGYGRPSRGLTFFELAPGFAATDVTIWPTEGYILYAVSGGDQLAFGIAAAP